MFRIGEPVLVSIMVMILSVTASAETVINFNSVRDNTLYESVGGTLSNGSGTHVFAGRVGGGEIRRAVIAFDLSSLPPGAIISDVALTLFNSKTITGNQTVTVHRVTSDWGEGASVAPGEEGGGAASTAGDATWIHTYSPGSPWTLAGGDFVAAPSASQTVGFEGLAYTWSSEQLADDVRFWIQYPGQNFGWIVLGDESSFPSAKRFDSREHANASVRPVLSITVLDVPASSLTSSALAATVIGVFAMGGMLLHRRQRSHLPEQRGSR